jgi:rhodanese-related sulfurtransferase
MRKLFFIITFGLSFSAMSCSTNTEQSNTTEQNEQGVTVISKDVDVTEFAELVSAGEGQILDVRTPEEWAAGIIKGATKMNFYGDDFKTQLETLDKNKPVYVYCKSGGRSGKATKQMKQMGFTAVYNLNGGMGAWASAGNETVQ